MNRENQTFSLLTPPACAPDYKILSDAAIHDLGLDYICGQITEKKSEQTLCLSILSKMTENPEVTRYRSDVFSDIYQNEAMRDEMLRILDKVIFLRDYGSIGRTFEESAGIWDLMHRLDELKDYIQCVEAIFKSLSDASVHSEGLLCLQRYIDDLYHDNGFLGLREAAEERMMRAKAFYNLKLAAMTVEKKAIVSNDLDFDREHLVYVLTGANRSFKIAMAPPEGMSYAGDIARKYGVTYEMLVNTN